MTTRPARPSPRPVLEADAESRLRTTVRTRAAVPLAAAWEAFVPVALPAVFPRRKGPIPAVLATSGQDGRWDVVGRSRRVHLGNGATVREEITVSDPCDGASPQGGQARFGYRVSGFSGLLGGIASEAHGLWRFREVGPGSTEILWTYAFVPRGWLGALPLRLILATFWRSYMQDGIENVRRIAEGRHP